MKIESTQIKVRDLIEGAGNESQTSGRVVVVDPGRRVRRVQQDAQEKGRGVMDDYEYIFGKPAEDWREPLGALRLTLTGDPDKVDVVRAQHEVEELVRVLNGVKEKR